MYISFFKKSIHVSVDGWVDLPLRYTVLKILFIYFLERGREGERGEKHNVWLPLVCTLLGTWLATQACALTGNQTGNPLLCRLALNPLSHTSQSWLLDILNNAVMNTSVQTSLCNPAFISFRHIPRGKLRDHIAALLLIF